MNKEKVTRKIINTFEDRKQFLDKHQWHQDYKIFFALSKIRIHQKVMLSIP